MRTFGPVCRRIARDPDIDHHRVRRGRRLAMERDIDARSQLRRLRPRGRQRIRPPHVMRNAPSSRRIGTVLIPARTVRKYDAIIAEARSITEKRKKSTAFSNPYAVGYNQIVMRKDPAFLRTRHSRNSNLTPYRCRQPGHLDKPRAALDRAERSAR